MQLNPALEKPCLDSVTSRVQPCLRLTGLLTQALQGLGHFCGWRPLQLAQQAMALRQQRGHKTQQVGGHLRIGQGALVEGQLVAEGASAQLQALCPELPGLLDGVA